MSKPRTTKSFITSDGGLKVCLEAREVTWFEFLWFSRGITSTDGGWDSKSNWWEWGVQKLIGTAPESLELWTKNSLKKTSLPRPRSGSFMLDREHSDRRCDLKQSFSEKTVENATENELSYALYEGGLGKLKPLADTRLLGYEIPLAGDSEGQLKVDLFGISAIDDAIEIIELKRARNQTDSPLIAFTEAICYALQTLRCQESLLNELKLKGCEKAFGQINLKILAPASYWKYWSYLPGTKLDPVTIRRNFQIILDRVNVGIVGNTEEGVHPKLSIALGELESLEGVCL